MYIKSLEGLIDLINDKYKSIYNYGIIEQATGHYLHTINERLKRPVFVVFENEKKSLDIYENLASNKLPVSYLPSIGPNYQLLEDLDFTNRAHRMNALLNLIANEPRIYITSMQAIGKKLLDPKIFKDQIEVISLESTIDQDDLVTKLIDLGYQRRSLIQAKGEFSVRGDIIDIFQVHDDQPTRLELFDVEVDSIRKFDINTQVSTKHIEQLVIYPMAENYYLDQDFPTIIDKIRQDIKNSKDKLDASSFERAQSKFEKLIEELQYNKLVSNIDLLLPYIKNNDASVYDYLPEDSLVIYEDIHKQFTKIDDLENFVATDIETRFENGELLSGHFDIGHQYKNIISKDNHQRINISPLLKSLADFEVDKIYEIKIRENHFFHGNFSNFAEDLRFRISNKYINNIFVYSMEDALNLQRELEDNEISSKIIKNIDEDNLHTVNLLLFKLDQGFDYYQDRVNFTSYSQIYKKVNKRKSKTVKNKEIINYVDLVHGDLLVHDNYGIGKYVGIKNIELNEIKSDFIELEYSQGDRLYVPTGDMSMVSKFIGKGDTQPKLSNLNGVEWRRSKARAKRAIEEIADDLVQLYAKRSQLQGFKYSPDSTWQKEFEDSFPYVETESQLRATSEIKKNMESFNVMDRLLSGDVGYGKTEVALRAAFKAIMDSKQVVMLAPTTILVKQHFDTMKERFKDFPIKIDYLSRFKTPSQKAKTIEGLKKGELDFVVGTHALLSDKVTFKNLGLLIIDEEQRFGVKHKEKIKELSADIDVLTLSATPIPRTLQMSLSGIRDMSLLDEHPQNRLPVNTYVMEYDPVYIREAILKEMSRRGQVFFVFNRVSGINRMYEKLKDLVPEARIAVSHGQMPTRELENILEDFSNFKYDILLTTTIIETGMDIQNVNTIIIYNADMMGLSQLYQLKGRVGRSDRNAFAYFTYAQGKVMTEIAEKRLKAIKDFTELGSGYKVAMRDLELRGAGNLLGESQSGHIESIGYDLYVRMLKEKINEIKGLKPAKPLKDVKIDLNLDVYIPNDYIEDENEKINIYKKISYIESEKDHYDIIDELTDRFGDIPISVQNIIDIAYIRAMMQDNNFDNLLEVESEIMLSYTNLETFNFEELKILAEEYKGEMRFEMVDNPTIIIPNAKNYTLKLIDLLKTISSINKEKR